MISSCSILTDVVIQQIHKEENTYVSNKKKKIHVTDFSFDLRFIEWLRTAMLLFLVLVNEFLSPLKFGTQSKCSFDSFSAGSRWRRDKRRGKHSTSIYTHLYLSVSVSINIHISIYKIMHMSSRVFKRFELVTFSSWFQPLSLRSRMSWACTTHKIWLWLLKILSLKTTPL